ncbi:MAG: hypothetical protein IH934_05470, partial [Nanoarchaeota archaeon]|nr:hypothetical protein [Nanoarchaeota archaeon]
MNDTSGNLKQNETIFVVNSPPAIKLNNVSGFTIDPVSGGTSKILISFNITDADGISDINATKAIVNLTLGSADDGQYRFNISDQGAEFGTCANHTEPGPGSEAARIIINCTIEMRYYDNASNKWTINISIEDTDGNVARNNTIEFTVATLSSFTLLSRGVGEGANLNFTNVQAGYNDIAAKAPLILNNTGNDDFITLN